MQFRPAVGKVLYIAEVPECGFEVKEFARQTAAPRRSGLARLRHTARYLLGLHSRRHVTAPPVGALEVKA